MAGYTTGALAQTNPNAMGDAIVNALTAGNTTIWLAPVVPPITSTDLTTKQILLVSTPAIDSWLVAAAGNASQTYRVLITFTMDTLGTYTAMTITLGDANQLAVNAAGTQVIVQNGTLTMTVFTTTTSATTTSAPSLTNEVNWKLSITDRGFALATWLTSYVNKTANNFVCTVQRPVNPTTGLPKTGGDAPIFALWSNATNTTNSFTWGIVRDKNLSTSRLIGSTATVGRYNMYRISMDWSHPNLFDNNSHVVKFAYGLATQSHLYLDELDLICFVNATAFASAQIVKITMYGETSERQYTTNWGSILYGNILGVTTPQPYVISGARIGVLSLNGGISGS